MCIYIYIWLSLSPSGMPHDAWRSLAVIGQAGLPVGLCLPICAQHIMYSRDVSMYVYYVWREREIDRHV